MLDQPGYGDTYGFHRIFSNGYFHYRTFSKTPKLKFVLAISKNDLTGTAEKFKKTIFNFINSFENWEDKQVDGKTKVGVKNQILKAISLLITKADPNTKVENLKSMIINLRESVAGMGSRQKLKYQGLLDEIVKTNRIYFIEKPKNIHQSTLDSPILQKIYDESVFWERPVHKNKNVVEMEEIHFSVSNEILKEIRDRDNELFREDF